MGPDRHDGTGGRACGGAGGAPVAVRGGGVSKSATKAPRTGIGRRQKCGISTILLRRSGVIRAFVSDLDNLHRRGPREGRRGPLHGRRPRRSPRSRAGPLRPPGAETCILHSKVQFQPSFSSAKCTSRRRSGPVAVVVDRGAGPARTAPRPPARAIMTIRAHGPPFPARKAHRNHPRGAEDGGHEDSEGRPQLGCRSRTIPADRVTGPQPARHRRPGGQGIRAQSGDRSAARSTPTDRRGSRLPLRRRELSSM